MDCLSSSVPALGVPLNSNCGLLAFSWDAASHRTASTLAAGRGLSAGEAGPVDADVLVADVIGRLLYLCGVADLTFIGGSLIPVGGHNPIEAAKVTLNQQISILMEVCRARR